MGEPFPIIGPHAVVGDLVDGAPEGFCFIRFCGFALVGAGDEDFAKKAVTVGEPEAERAAGFEGTGRDPDFFEGFTDCGIGRGFAGLDFSARCIDVSCTQAAFFFDEKNLVPVKDEAEDSSVDGGPVNPIVG